MASGPRVEVEAHPPERGAPRSVVVACGCSCCCCCCCLHSVGGVIGAAIASAGGAAAGDALVSRSIAKRIYWVAVLFLVACIPGPLFAPGHGVHEIDDAFWIAFLGVALGLPVIQLGAAVLSLLVVLVAPGTMIPEKGSAAGAIGRLALGTFLGSLAGILAMVLLALPLLSQLK